MIDVLNTVIVSFEGLLRYAMREAKRCTVGGYPIEHSLTPYLFALVHEHLGLEYFSLGKIASEYIDEVINCNDVSKPSEKFKETVREITQSIDGEFFDCRAIPEIKVLAKDFDFNGIIKWGSITSPLKHQFGKNIVNCYTVDERGLRYSMTDGFAVILVAEHFGLNFNSNPVLCLKGGGSTAIATAEAWLSRGGEIKALNGRRSLPEYLLIRCNSELEPNLFLDFDSSSDSDYLTLTPKYASKVNAFKNNIDGRWMLIAQHLLSWAILFSPENAEKLPSMDLLFKRLISLESSGISMF